MHARGERFTVDELLTRRPSETDECQPVLDRAASGFRFLVSKRPAASARTEVRQPRWTALEFQTFDGRTLSWGAAADEIKESAELLEKIHVSLQKPSPDPGWDYTLFGVPPGYSSGKRIVAQFLANASVVSLHQNRMGAAFEHLLALLRLAQHHVEDRFLLSQRVRVSLAILAAEVTVEILQAPGWTEAQLGVLQAAWSQVELLAPVIRAIEMERALGSLYFDDIRTGKNPVFPTLGQRSRWQSVCQDYLLGPLYQRLWIASDEWFYLRSMQVYLDGLRQVQAHGSWVREQPEIQEQFDRCVAAGLGMTWFRYRGTATLMLKMDTAMDTLIRAQTLQQLAIAALAVGRYQVRHQKNPPNLEVLIPEFCREMPVDFSDGRPVRYRRRSDRTFLLYGVGSDGIDHAGVPPADLVWWPVANSR